MVSFTIGSLLASFNRSRNIQQEDQVGLGPIRLFDLFGLQGNSHQLMLGLPRTSVTANEAAKGLSSFGPDSRSRNS